MGKRLYDASGGFHQAPTGMISLGVQAVVCCLFCLGMHSIR